MNRIIAQITTTLVLTVACGCSPAPSTPEIDPLSNNYVGTLQLDFTQTLPEINETVRMDVQLNRDGSLVVTPGTLSYDGESAMDESRIRRTGQVALAPTGNWFDSNGEDWIEIVEHGSGQERMQQWVFDGVEWQQVVDVTVPIAWAGGLAFQLNEAVFGAVVESSSTMGTVRWTLTLTPTLD